MIVICSHVHGASSLCNGLPPSHRVLASKLTRKSARKWFVPIITRGAVSFWIGNTKVPGTSAYITVRLEISKVSQGTSGIAVSTGFFTNSSSYKRRSASPEGWGNIWIGRSHFLRLSFTPDVFQLWGTLGLWNTVGNRFCRPGRLFVCSCRDRHTIIHRSEYSPFSSCIGRT